MICLIVSGSSYGWFEGINESKGFCFSELFESNDTTQINWAERPGIPAAQKNDLWILFFLMLDINLPNPQQMNRKNLMIKWKFRKTSQIKI